MLTFLCTSLYRISCCNLFVSGKEETKTLLSLLHFQETKKG